MLSNTRHNFRDSVHARSVTHKFPVFQNHVNGNLELISCHLKGYVNPFRKPHIAGLWMQMLCISGISFHKECLYMLCPSRWNCPTSEFRPFWFSKKAYIIKYLHVRMIPVYIYHKDGSFRYIAYFYVSTYVMSHSLRIRI